MKNVFQQYYRPSDEEFTELWNSSIFVVDTNILLNLYRYSAPLATDLQNLLEHFQQEGRLWLPYQVGLEFHQNRISEIKNQEKKFEEVIAGIKEIQNRLSENRNHPYLTDESYNSFVEYATKIITEIDNHKAEYLGLVETDGILERITTIYTGCVGSEFSLEQKREIEKDADDRYSQNVPPGYSDVKKSKPDRYGDYYIWKEILQLAKSKQQGVIFITDDVKEDWYLRIGGRTVGPRPELLKEFNLLTGQSLYIYNAEQFLRYGKTHTGDEFDEKFIEELKRRRDELSIEIKKLKAKAKSNIDQLQEENTEIFLDDDGEPVSTNKEDAVKLVQYHAARIFLEMFREAQEKKDKPN